MGGVEFEVRGVRDREGRLPAVERAGCLFGNICFSFGFLQRKLLHNSFLLVIIKHLCSNFCCRNAKEK